MPFDNTELFIPAPVVIETDAVLRLLQAMREYHSDPARWCNTGMGDGVRDACIIHAEYKISGRLHVAQRWLERVLPPNSASIVSFNEKEGRTHADLMALYDRAISLRQAELAGA